MKTNNRRPIQRLTESQLRNIIRQEVRRLNESAGPTLDVKASAGSIISLIHSYGKQTPGNIRVLSLDKLDELIKGIERQNVVRAREIEKYGPRHRPPPAGVPQFPSVDNPDLLAELEARGVEFDEAGGVLSYDSTDIINQTRAYTAAGMERDRARGYRD
jgi:hypothetical protein